jgi:hypothetical protein
MRLGHAGRLSILAIAVAAFYSPHLLSGTTRFDGLDVHYATQRYLSDAIRAGRLPFWTPNIFSGFPILADLQTGAWYPLNWPFFLIGITPNSMNLEVLLHSLIASCGAYALAGHLRLHPIAGVATGLFYGLGGFFAAHTQHVGIVQTAAWLPWLVLLVDTCASSGLTLLRYGVAGLLGAMLALPGHFQTALYTFTFVSVWALLDPALCRAWLRQRRGVMVLAASAVWGAAIAAIMILPGLELARLSLRSRVHAGDLNLGYFHPDSLLTLIHPNYYGMFAGGPYTGPGDVTQHYFYAGLLLVPLALIGLLTHARVRRMALLLGLPFLWYALGPTGGLFELTRRVPGFGSIELPMHGWFLPALGLALLGGSGVDWVLRHPRVLRLRWLYAAAAVALALLWVDLFIFNALLNRLGYSRVPAEAQFELPIRSLQRELATVQGQVGRVYGDPMTSIGYRNHPLQVGIEATYGYNPLELALYSDYEGTASDNPRLIDGLAATHRIVIDRDGMLRAEPNPTALPLAYFPPRIRAVPDAAAALQALATLDPARETLVYEPVPPLQPAEGATATVVVRADDAMRIRYSSPTPNLLRVGIPRYPGWRATLNGSELPTLTVDYALLGVLVPPGEGEVHLHYVPRFFWPAAAMSTVALLAALFVLAHGLRAIVGMAKAKRTNVKTPHKDSAAKNTMNPPGGGGGTQELGGTGTQAQDPKRRIGQHSGAGEPPLMKK